MSYFKLLFAHLYLLVRLYFKCVYQDINNISLMNCYLLPATNQFNRLVKLLLNTFDVSSS